MAHSIIHQLFFYGYGLFSWCLYLGISLSNGSFFKKDTEQDRLQHAIARDEFWNLSKSPIPGFSHRFLILRTGFKLHYITNHDNTRAQDFARANLAIFIHGFPDSCLMWRHLLSSSNSKDLQKAILVCVDLPGYGGSDSFPLHGADEVLDALAEFVIAMREQYLEDEDDAIPQAERRTYIVAHDWGCVVAMRLAADASCLADRYILMNGPHVELALANKDRIMESSAKIFRQFKQSPMKNRACLSKSVHALKPLLYQILLFGYIFAFHLPAFMVRYLCTGGNFSFYRGAQSIAYGKHKEEYNVQQSLAATFGPSVIECRTQTSSSKPETYGKTVSVRASSPGNVIMSQTSYYRDGLAFDHWTKSLEIIADLHSIQLNNANGSPVRRRSSSGSGTLFAQHYKGSLNAPTTILWGQKDQACSQAICLDGIGDYLTRDSEVVLFPKTGHWFPVEKESRGALAQVLNYYVCQDNVVGNVGELTSTIYPGATVVVKK